MAGTNGRILPTARAKHKRTLGVRRLAAALTVAEKPLHQRQWTAFPTMRPVCGKAESQLVAWRISEQRRSKRAARFGSCASANFQHSAVVFPNQTLDLAAASTRGNIKSKWYCKRSSSRQVAMAALTSSSSCEPHLRTNGQIASGSLGTKEPISIAACHRGSSEPPGAGCPRRSRSAFAIASETVIFNPRDCCCIA